MMIDLFAPG